jgi:hypothetical protein
MSTVTWDGNEYSEKAFRTATELMVNSARSTVGSRGDVVKHLGQQYSGERDIYEVLGYDREISEEQYRAKYKRQDIAHRVIELPPNDTWRLRPTVTDALDQDEESEFEKQFNTLSEDLRLFHYLRRADIASRIGEYGVLFLGLSDGNDLDEEPGQLSGPDDVAYLSPFAQDNVDSWTLGKEDGRDVSNARYNMPIAYSLDFGADDKSDIQEVHWKRVIHIAEGTIESDLKGTPPLRPIYNRLEDRQKVIGASAEMFWTGADQKYHFNIDSDNAADIPDDELDALDEEVQKLVHDMENYLKTFNTDLEVIDGQEVDPSGVVDAIDTSIALQAGIPKRVLTGSEKGELASTQDRATWYGRVERRQNRYAQPTILKPTMWRFIDFGALPQPNQSQFIVDWPNLFELNEIEKSEVMQNRAEGLARLAPQGNTDLVAQPDELFKFVVDGREPDFDTRNETPLSEQQSQPASNDQVSNDS